MSGIQKNDLYTVKIEGYTSTGAGVARVNGHVVFVKGAICGETCVVRILKAGNNAVYAKIEKILEESDQRITPACPNFSKCGGCDLMHMSYSEELRFKKNRVDDALQRIGGLDIYTDAITGSDRTEGSRNKAIYAVGEKNGHVITGFYRERSHDIIPTEKCLIQADFADRAACAVRRWMEEKHIHAYDTKTKKGAVRHVFSRFGFVSGQGQVTIVSAVDRLPYRERLINIIREECPEAVSIVQNTNKTAGNTVLSGQFYTLWGKDYIEDELCSLRFELSARSFYQVNREQAERLYEKAAEYAGLTRHDTVLDLYCGTGTITLRMAKDAHKAIGAEVVSEAISDAKRNAEKNSINNVEFICADARAAAEKLFKRGVRPNVVVVDPPRKGLASEVIDTVTQMRPDRIVYVSCDPATLARDLKIFTQKEYDVIKSEAFDLFPRTCHVECVVLMSRR